MTELGFEYAPYEICVTPERQAEKLECCDVDPAVFGGYVDITHFAMESIMAARRAGASINGNVHVAQVFEQREPVALGETVSLAGRVSRIEPHPRGRLVSARFEVTRANGDVPLVMERTSLHAAADDMQRSGSAAAARAPSPASEDNADAVLLATHQLAPDKVARFSNEADNLIHSDPEVAKAFGFAKPIAGGLMAVRMMMASLWRDGPVATLEMSVRFRRPMFWDECLDLYAPQPSAHELRLVRRSDGKVLNDAHIHALTRAV